MCKIVFRTKEPIAAKHLFSSSNLVFSLHQEGSTHQPSQAKVDNKEKSVSLVLHPHGFIIERERWNSSVADTDM